MNWLENMVLQSKLILLTAVMMIALGVLGYLGYDSTQKWQQGMNEVGGVRLPSVVGIMEMRTGINQVVIQQNRVRSLQGDPKMKEKLEDARERLVKGFERFDKGFAIYAPLPQTPEEAVEWKTFEENFGKWKEMSLAFRANTLVPLINNTNPAMEAVYFEQMKMFIETSRAPRSAALESMDKIAQINIDIGNEEVKKAIESSASAVQLTMTIVAIAFALALVLSTLIIRSITRAITVSCHLLFVMAQCKSLPHPIK
jgi:methyl-accepting chemotaxis protein